MNMKIAVLQIDSVLGDIASNLNKVDEMIAGINDKDVRLAVFCEYGLTGYCTDLTKIANPVPGADSEGLAAIAKKHNIWIIGGTAELVGDKIANTALIVSPKDGFVTKYRKIHPFGDERNSIIYGDEPVVVDTDIGKVGVVICFDLCFPELIRALALKGAEIVVCPTFWFADSISGPGGWKPESTIALARTRALENNIFMAMACRTGEETASWSKVRAFGHSCITDSIGNILALAGLGETVITAELDPGTRKKWAEYSHYLADRRPDIYGKILDF